MILNKYTKFSVRQYTKSERTSFAERVVDINKQLSLYDKNYWKICNA